MKTKLNVTDTQAIRISKQGTGDEMLFPVMMVQPSNNYYLHRVNDNYACFAHNRFKMGQNDVAMSVPDIPDDKYIDVKIPYPKGTILGIRESYAILGTEQCPWPEMPHKIILDENGYKYCHVYKASFDRCGAPRWHSSATMPHKAIIRQYEVIGNEVKRVQDMTWEEMQQIIARFNDKGEFLYKIKHIMGHLDNDFTEWFNSLFAKPRAVKKNGEIVKYVTYPYSMMSFWEKNYCNNVISLGKRGEGAIYEHKGLPLEIYDNPYIFLMKGVKL